MSTARALILIVALIISASAQRGGGGGGGGGGRNSGSSSSSGDSGAGCCYGSDAKCVTDSESTCTKMAARKGCEWRSGEDADCTFIAEPGCCFSSSGNTKCNVNDEATCTKLAKRAGCQWISGDDADCGSPPTEPPFETGCCSGSDPKCDTDDEATCNRFAARKGCQWQSGMDAICDPVLPPAPVTSAPTPTPVDQPDAYICTECNEDGCCYMDPTRSYWYRCDRRWPWGSGWGSWDTAESGCISNQGYGCEWREGPDAFDCAQSPEQSNGCCVSVDPTNPNAETCAVLDEYWGKDVCILKGGSYGCEWREGATKGTAECEGNTEIKCNDQYSCNEGKSGYHISCNADFSCGNMGADPVIDAQDGIDCYGFQSCDGANLKADGNIDCGGQWSCTGFDNMCIASGKEPNTITAGGALYCGGYQSCSWNPQIEASVIICNGEESCAGNTNVMNGVAQTKCMGQRACSGSVIMSPSVQCTGRDSCSNAQLIGQEAYCHGTGACANAVFGDRWGDQTGGIPNALESVVVTSYHGAESAAILQVPYIEAVGFESLYRAAIHSLGIPEMTVVLSGKWAGNLATASCIDSECLILCWDDSCDGFRVYCQGDAECTFGAGLSTNSYTEIDCVSNSGDELTVGSDKVVCPLVSVIASEDEMNAMEEMEFNEDDAPKIETLDCGDVGRAKAQKLKEENTVLLHSCDGEGECSSNTFDDGDFYDCTGDSSCENAMFSDVGGAYCKGRESCRSSELLHGQMLCGGKGSCEHMNYGDDGDLWVECNGNSACDSVQKNPSWADSDWATKDRNGGTNDDNDGSQYFACRGYESCDNARLVNVSTCSGARGCGYMAIYVADNIECGGNEACGLGWFYDNEGDILCDGNVACSDARLFKADNLYCDGNEACARARIYGPNVLYARGKLAMDMAVINSCHDQGCDTNPADTARDITIYAYGENAMKGATLRCYGGSTCNLHCFGNACSSMASYQCYPGAICNCDGPDCAMVGMEEEVDSKRRNHQKKENEEKYAFQRIGFEVNATEQMSGSMLLYGGAGAVVMLLVVMFYFVGGYGSKKEELPEYAPLEWE